MEVDGQHRGSSLSVLHFVFPDEVSPKHSPRGLHSDSLSCSVFHSLWQLSLSYWNLHMWACSLCPLPSDAVSSEYKIPVLTYILQWIYLSDHLYHVCTVYTRPAGTHYLPMFPFGLVAFLLLWHILDVTQLKRRKMMTVKERKDRKGAALSNFEARPYGCTSTSMTPASSGNYTANSWGPSAQMHESMGTFPTPSQWSGNLLQCDIRTHHSPCKLI